MKPDYEITEFKDQKSWRQWLHKHHANTDGVWVRMYKKATGIASVNYAQALDEALCYGWIDGQKKTYDEQSFIQKFTPRRTKSMWSKRNIEYIARLEAAGLLTPAGIAEVERAKADGRWEMAYDSPSNMVLPEDFMTAVSNNAETLAYFNTLSKTAKYSIGFGLHTAKRPETRQNRFNKYLEMLEKGEKPN